jgi:hypothetical protein
MKKVLLIIVLVLCRIYAPAQNIEFAEISFYQDSVNPMTIHLICKAKCAMYTTFAHDAETIYWGDGTQNLVSLADTSYAYPGLIATDPLKTYKISHTFATTFADSTIYIGLYMQDGIYEYVADAINDPAGMPLCPVATINFAYMKNHTGINPPHFSSYYTFVTDTVFQALDFYPQIVYDSSYTLDVQNIPVNIFYPSGNAGGIIPPNLVHTGPDNVITCDSSDGYLIWNYPHGYGGYMFSYTAAIYRNDTFVCSMMRDFIVDILDTSTTTGIVKIGMNDLTIYPNPVSDRLIVNTSISDFSFTVLDMTGRICSAPSSGHEIDVSALPSGIYLLRIQDSGGSVVRKFVKE